MKRFLYVIAIVFSTFFLISNSAQPGVWNAGGSGVFKLLYPEDSVAYKKIQMQSENIYMQLYHGFATVKGDYYFKNTSKDTLKIKVGYPINNVFENISHSQYANHVAVDGLYKIKGFVNKKEVEIYKKPNDENDNWYVWEVTFPPNKITEFTVNFLVNTNNAKILKGYNSEYKNAFIYLIETGSLWKSPIEIGSFYIQLKDEISIDNAKASAPTPLFLNQEKNVLKFTMTDYGKTPDPNFVFTYGKTIDNFNFKEITKNSDAYFKELNQFSKNDFNTYTFNSIELASAYKVDGVSNSVVGFMFYLITYGIPILLIILIFFIIKLIYKKIKNRK